MVARWRTTSPDPGDAAQSPSFRPSRRQVAALLAVFLLVAGAVSVASYVVRPDHARAYTLLRGSTFIKDSAAPVAVDIASGRPTLRLVGAADQVGLTSTANLDVVPSGSGTLLLNRSTGEFAMVDNTGFVLKHAGGGVTLPARTGATSGSTTSFGVPYSAQSGAADGLAYYVVRTGQDRSDVYLVDGATVSAATGHHPVDPSATATMTGDALTSDGGSVGAAGQLWLLVHRPDGGNDVIQLARRDVATAGAALTRTDRDTVPAAAALASATTGSTGPTGSLGSAASTGEGSAVADADSPASAAGASGSAPTSGMSDVAVGVASADGIRVFGTDGQDHDIRFSAPAGLDRVVAATSGADRLTWLMHGGQGWFEVSVAADGSDRQGPSLLRGIPTTANLATPAMSDGDLYTGDRGNGALYRITSAGQAGAIPGAASYPIVRNSSGRETSQVKDLYLVADGPRVIIDSALHYDALTVYTDGSHRPFVFQKSSALDVSASGGTEALTTPNVDTVGGKSRKTTQPRRQTTQPINNRLDCRTINQKPLVPSSVFATAQSRSADVSWTYLFLPSTCAPDRYDVTVTPEDRDGAGHTVQIDVRNQLSVTVPGLYPATAYKVTVTAYVNQNSTPSVPYTFTTAPQGPAAPTGVRVAANDTGSWQLSWAGCGTAQQGCVTVASWRIVPSFCDGLGGSAPAPATVTASQTTREQPLTTYPGGGALLGRGLSFQIVGVGTLGQPGSPSVGTPCVYSWTRPDAAALSVSANTTATAGADSATSATAALHTTGSPIADLGGVGATLTYQLLSDGQVVHTVGPVTSTAPVTIPGVQPGRQYSVQVLVSPPRHPEVVETIGPSTVFATTAAWPTLAASASVADTGATTATLTLDLSGLSTAGSHGERFDLTNSALVCGSASQPLTATDIDPSRSLTFSGIDRTLESGTCSAHVQLAQDANDATTPPLYGSGPSAVATTGRFTIDSPSLVGVDATDFTAAWDGQTADGRSVVLVTYAGSNGLLLKDATGWTVSVTDPDGATCGSYSGDSSLHSLALDQTCVTADGASGQDWMVQVSFTFFGSAEGPYTLTPVSGGAAPTYNPPVCDVADASISASWSGTAAAPSVTVTAADPADLADCTTWTYAVLGPTSATPCGDDQGVAPPDTIVLGTCSDQPSAGDWHVVVGYNDLSHTHQASTLDVTGDPPS